MFIEHLAQEAAMSASDCIHVTLGLSRCPMGRPPADSIAEMGADARALLGRIGVDPAPHFSEESVQVQADENKTAAERGVRSRVYRPLTASLRAAPLKG